MSNFLTNYHQLNQVCPLSKGPWCALPEANFKTVLPDWTLLGNEFEIDREMTWTKVRYYRPGPWSMDLSANQPYGIQKTVNLNRGGNYKVTFFLRRNPYCGGDQKTLYVSASGNQLKEFTSTDEWKRQSYPFTSLYGKTTIELGDKSGNSCGSVIKNVNIVPQ